MLSNPQNESKPTHKSRSQSLEVYLTVGGKKKDKPQEFSRLPHLQSLHGWARRAKRVWVGYTQPSLMDTYTPVFSHSCFF